MKFDLYINFDYIKNSLEMSYEPESTFGRLACYPITPSSSLSVRDNFFNFYIQASFLYKYKKSICMVIILG